HQYIKTMLNLFSNRNLVLACSADCPADNHARPLAQFLYETLYAIACSEWSFFADPGLTLKGVQLRERKDIPFGSVPKYCGDEIVESLLGLSKRYHVTHTCG